MRRFLQALILIAMLVPLTVGAQTDTVDLRYRWARPTTGTYCVAFEIERSLDGGDWTMYATADDTTLIVTTPIMQEIRIRIRGVDQWDVRGPWSLASAAYTPESPGPGACGQPQREE